jgi:hypothetical protein
LAEERRKASVLRLGHNEYINRIGAELLMLNTSGDRIPAGIDRPRWRDQCACQLTVLNHVFLAFLLQKAPSSPSLA